MAKKQLQVPGTERKDINPKIEELAEKYVKHRDEAKKEKALLLALMDENNLTKYVCSEVSLTVEVAATSRTLKVSETETEEDQPARIPAPKKGKNGKRPTDDAGIAAAVEEDRGA